MRKIYLSKDAGAPLVKYLQDKGYSLEFVSSSGVIDENISNHPDMFLCKMGVAPSSPIFFADENSLERDYPGDIAFNAACTGKYFIHKLSCTNERLLLAAKEMGMTLIDVNQGYTKCSVAIVDENSIITYDEGIVRSCMPYKDLSVLKIAPGFIALDGYDTGFVGGTCGRIEDEMIFNGDLFRHPDFNAIVDFVESRGLKCKWFSSYKLTDIGSII